ncbi:TolC family protein [Terriglobus sp.]|uniref:TolC family protein n=1 Tax=Terriglobus sp. TaxID=1889013 RepID=UPI003B0077FE
MKVLNIVLLLSFALPIVAQTRATATDVKITRDQAEQLALANNPRISADKLLALAEGETVREQRSALLPQVAVNLTAVQAEDASRIGAGQLTSSRLYTHAGAGGTLSQLITDFGHTGNLVASARLRTEAQQQSARATQQDVVFATDQAFYRLLSAQALLDVANQTVAARRDVQSVTGALAQNKLKSDLDVNIAAADASQAQLLQLDATNQVQSASAALAALLAAPAGTVYTAVDSAAALPLPPEDAGALERDALATRPDLKARALGANAEEKLARAESLQHLPTITATAVAGVTPVRPDGVFGENWYAAGGINLNLPIFTGFRISSEAREAELRAQAQQKQAANLGNVVQRDVRTATLSAQTAFQRIAVTEAFQGQAAQALSLAQTRYQLGLSSIVELSQAQLQSTQAAVAAAGARFDYLLALRSLDYVTGRITP